MDTNTINHVSLCSGYGGIDLGLKRAVGSRLRTVAFVEIEAFAAANLAAKAKAGLLDDAPIWSDLKRFPWGKFHGLVDILSGGYPCQPFSAAGKRLGAEDPRHLWPYISAGIAAMRPAVCFFENVEGHISLGLPDVIEDLGRLGYRTTWCVASASECGAPHQRKRVFILAHCKEQGLEGYRRLLTDGVWDDAGQSSTAGGVANAQLHGRDHANARPHADGIQGTLGQGHEHQQALGELANSSSQRDRESQQGISLANQCLSWREEGSADAGRCLQAWPSRPGEQQFAWEPPRVVSGRQTLDDTQKRCLRDDSDNQRQTVGESDTANDSGPCSGEAMGNAASRIAEQQGSIQSEEWRGVAAAGEAMGNSESQRDANRSECSRRVVANEPEQQRQTQPPLGRDADGPADRLDDAELYTTCDNRTDELRLLGNGVVPAVAERAFQLLVSELMEHQL